MVGAGAGAGCWRPDPHLWAEFGACNLLYLRYHVRLPGQYGVRSMVQATRIDGAIRSVPRL